MTDTHFSRRSAPLVAGRHPAWYPAGIRLPADPQSETGAKALARHIKRAWEDAGVPNVSVIVQRSRELHDAWEVRSNLVNGMAPR